MSHYIWHIIFILNNTYLESSMFVSKFPHRSIFPSISAILTIHKGRKALLHAAQLEQAPCQGQSSRS